MDTNRTTDDIEFIFTYNFNKVNQLSFSKAMILGTEAYKSSIYINPSINDNSTQNVISLAYLTSGQVMNVHAAMTDAYICKNFFSKQGKYVLVLSGSIISQSTATLYLVIPFDTASVDTDPVSNAITKFGDAYQSQSMNGMATNDLIEPNPNYIYGLNPDFKQNPIEKTNFNVFLYNTTVKNISNTYEDELSQLAEPNKAVDGILLFKNPNGIAPSLTMEQSTEQIEIECLPFQMIPDDKKKVMLTVNDIVNVDTDAESIFAKVITLIIALILIVALVMLAKHIRKTFIKNPSGIVIKPAV